MIQKRYNPVVHENTLIHWYIYTELARIILNSNFLRSRMFKKKKEKTTMITVFNILITLMIKNINT